MTGSPGWCARKGWRAGAPWQEKQTTIPDEAALERARTCSSETSPQCAEREVGGGHHLPQGPGTAFYLAFILDYYSRTIVGWQLATHLGSELVLDALEMANGLRRPEGGLAHTDRDSTYTHLAYTDRLDELGIAPSVDKYCLY